MYLNRTQLSVQCNTLGYAASASSDRTHHCRVRSHFDLASDHYNTDGNNASGLHFLVLKQLSLADVRFSESSLRALLSACPVLQSLLLKGSIGLSRVQIASPTLRSIGVRSNHGRVILRQVIIEDAPCLERLLCFDYLGITISVISAPKLLVLGPLSDQSPRLELGTTVIQVSVSPCFLTFIFMRLFLQTKFLC